MNFFGEPSTPNSFSKPQPKAADSAELTIRPVSSHALAEFVAWVDPLKDSQQVSAALKEFERRANLQSHSPAPLEAYVGDQRVAGAYMILLGARVAAVAGVRGIDNHDTTAASLLKILIEQVRAAGVVQIQAILDGTVSIAEEIVELAGFSMLAELQQMALLLPRNARQQSIEPAQLPPDLQWIDARTVPTERLILLLAHTFIETLDCPALNGIRTPADVLEGFLDGMPLASQEQWWILASSDKLLGCSFVNALPGDAAELVYMGLGVSKRGRGYGKLLLEQAVRSALRLGAETLLAAVDTNNWPAIRLYAQAGFQEHARVQAWLHR